MKFFIKLLIACCLFLTGSKTFSQSKIISINAKLFYNEKSSGADKDVSGNFSENVIGNPDTALWNAIIGGGSAEGNSNQTIVIVEISSKGMSNKNQVVRLTIVNGKKTSIQQQNFSCVDCTGTYKALFLINNTGCEKIKLKGELLKNNKSISVLNKTIDFECGE